MAAFKLCVLGIFTVLVVRALAARGTMSERTYGVYFLFGILYGLVLAPVLTRITSPYNEQGPWIAFFSALFFLVALSLPVYFAFFKSRAFQASSIADVFIVAFLLGFGVDFGRQFLFALSGPEVIPGYLSFPPFVNRTGEGVATLAGNAYWCSFIALVFSACMRFARNKAVAWAAGIAALLLMAIEAGAYTVVPSGVWGTVYKIGKTGALTPWIVVIGVIALSIWESRWSAKLREPGKFPLLEEWQTLLSALVRGRFREFAALASQYRTVRRSEIAAAVAADSPDNPALQATAVRLASRAGSKSETGVPNYGKSDTKPPAWWAVWGGWIAFAFLIVILPKLPKGFGNWLWNFWGFHFVLPNLPFTILTLALTIVLARRLIGSAGRPARRGRPDDVVAFFGERAILLTCFAIALAAIIYAFPERLFAYTPLVGEPPAAPLHGAKTMLMVIAIAGTGIALNRSRKWQAAPIADKRRFALRTSLDVLTVTLVVVLVNMTYLSQLEKIHAKYGAALFRKYQGDGNYVAAIVLAFLIGIVSLGLLYVARRWNRRAEEFMVGEHVG